MTTMDANPPEPAAVATAAPATRRHILLADDTVPSLQLLTRLLRHLVDAEVHEARDGTAALAQFNLLKPVITMLDIDMPDMDGLTVLEQIRAIDPNAFVVMVSGYSKPELVRRAVELGVGGFVVKPYSPQRIASVLRQYADKTGDKALLRHG